MKGPARELFTIESAKVWLRHRAASSGGHCPVCNRFTKIYRRQITSSMARFLIDFWHEHKDFEFHHVGRNYRKCGDYAKLSYWGLIIARGDDGELAKASGYWRMSQRGYDFIHLKTTVSKYVRVYDGQVLGYEGDKITIKEAIHEKFDYGKLMA